MSIRRTAPASAWNDVSRELSDIHGCLGNMVAQHLRSFAKGYGPAAMMHVQVDHASYLEVLQHTLLSDAETPDGGHAADWYTWKFTSMNNVLGCVERQLAMVSLKQEAEHEPSVANSESSIQRRSKKVTFRMETSIESASKVKDWSVMLPSKDATRDRALADRENDDELLRCEQQLLRYLSDVARMQSLSTDSLRRNMLRHKKMAQKQKQSQKQKLARRRNSTGTGAFEFKNDADTDSDVQNGNGMSASVDIDEFLKNLQELSEFAVFRSANAESKLRKNSICSLHSIKQLTGEALKQPLNK